MMTPGHNDTLPSVDSDTPACPTAECAHSMGIDYVRCKVESIMQFKSKKYSKTICVHTLTDESADYVEGLYPFQSHLRVLLSNITDSPCNVLVASPTGSGKTFAIEEATRKALCTGQHLFVTQPLIALAEQVFARIGGGRNNKICLRTGPSCSVSSDDACVTVCTYEVLSRMCLKCPQALDTALMVIIDEIHYIASDRGPAILEILHACSRVPIVALSGTLPNQKQFAEFLASINCLPTFVTGARRRPIPVSYHTYDSKSCTCHVLKTTWPAAPPSIESEVLGGINNKQDLLACICCLQKWDSLPLLVVLFSCRKLEQFAEWASCQDHLNSNEKGRVTVLFRSMMRNVPEEDAVLFQALHARALRGIGSHHSHLPVPYLELVCRLAEERLVKIVFSSSTLSAGINLPVRTVLICGARMPQRDSTGKMTFDLLSPLLFTQLAGRAGRPGFESRGFCIIATTGKRGYASAQGLFMRRLQPVIPYDGLTEGDVLRACRHGRKIGVERTVFAHPEAKTNITYANELTHRLHRVRATCGYAISARAKAAADAILIIEQNPNAVTYARKAHDCVLCMWKSKHKIYCVAPREAAPSGATEITMVGSRQGRRIPLHIFAVVQATRLAMDTVAAAGEEALALASAEIYVQQNCHSCFLSPLALEENAIVAAMPAAYVSREAEGAVLTPLGQAACNIRTSTSPCILMDILLSTESDLSSETLAGILSLALGEGRTDADNKDAGDSDLLEVATVLQIIKDNPRLNDFSCLTQRSLTQGVILWVRGESLESICMRQSLCSVGTLCRHLVRVHDLAEETSQFCLEISVVQLALVCRQVLEQLCRGLPFLKRGSGRVS